jgi:hypothetical protein
MNHIVGGVLVGLTELEYSIPQFRPAASGDVDIDPVALTQRLVTRIGKSVTHQKGGVVKRKRVNFGVIEILHHSITKAWRYLAKLGEEVEISVSRKPIHFTEGQWASAVITREPVGYRSGGGVLRVRNPVDRHVWLHRSGRNKCLA